VATSGDWSRISGPKFAKLEVLPIYCFRFHGIIFPNKDGEFMARPHILSPSGNLLSDLWIDQPSAPQIIGARLEQNEITNEEAVRLNKFFDDGYVIFPSGLTDNFFLAAISECRKLWLNRPEDLLAASNSFNGGRPMSLGHFPADFAPGPGCRMLDSHSHNAPFADLMSLPILHRFIDLLLGEKSVATQSLYFSHGSGQPLHRDPWFVVTTPVSTLFAAWVALEDISPDSGPLSIVAKSHRLRYKPLNTGDIIFHDPQATADARDAHVKDMHKQMADSGLVAQPFLAKRGDILIWHGSLIHGGSPVQKSTASRESLVIHFDAANTRKNVAQGLVLDGRRLGTFDTTVLRNRGGNVYFENPVFGKKLTQLIPID
jgi:phytanoyl-CoA hydroxylase